MEESRLLHLNLLSSSFFGFGPSTIFVFWF